jgi:ribosomal protein S18 acetylase RimI-like enzyme
VIAPTHTNIRNARATEIVRLATIWYEGWQDAHARILPVELARVRTLESFGARLRRFLASVRVAGPNDEPVGFCIVKGAELHQLYVSSRARGSGVAAALVADAETHLRETGVRTARLGCAIGNERAARFYEKCGWHRAGVVTEHLDTPGGSFALAVWRYEKSLTEPSPSPPE